MKLEVCTIGTELLLGHTTDTNAVDLGRALAAAGVEVVRRTTVPDRPRAIRDAVADALTRTGAVLTTGGLGPTRDDLTKPIVAELFGMPLKLDAGLLTALEARFRRAGRDTMPPSNRSQAEVPEGAVILPNPRGTAPGLWLEDAAGRLAILLPGVPREMRGLLTEQVLPRLVARVGAAPRVVRSRTLRTTGVPESALGERVGPLEEALAPLSLAYIPSADGVDLRLTAWSLDPAEADRLLAAGADRLRRELGAHCYGEDEADLAAVVLGQARARRARLAVAESCTGGLLGARLTAVPGASDTFVGGTVAYDDAVKTGVLGVPAEILERHGAVSEEAVRAMAAGAARVFGVRYALAITGIAGPGGGTPEKPVGTVWLALQADGATAAVRRVFPGDRAEIRARSAQAALDLLRRHLGEG
ncbi:MAG TPA: competence/damage-inducible protein A [Gemmatimonadales bacterium]